MKPYLLISLLCLVHSLFAQITDISDGEIFDGEPFMVVNSTNTQHIVIMWMGFNGLDLVTMKLKISEDGGTSWSDEIVLPHTNPGYTAADPSMGYDSDGNLFICYIDYNPLGTAGKVITRKSADGGYTWSDPAPVIDVAADGSETPVDRPWMVIDRSGTASDGNIYVTTKPAPWIPFPNRNYFIASTDYGASFGDWRYIDTIGWQIGDFIAAPMASPAVGIDGTVFCIYPAWEPSENLLPRFILAQSTNAGNHFTYSEVFESYGDDTNVDTSAKVAYLLKTNPTDANKLVFAYILSSFGDMDIFIRTTTNKGVSWSAPIRVNDDAVGSGAMQELVWADYDSDGDLVVSWRDRRNSVDTGYATETEIYGAVWWKDSIGFGTNFKISELPAGFDSVLYGNGNDFMCVEMEQDTIYATWGDTKNGYLNIWFNKLAANNTGNTSIHLIGSESVEQVTLFPNPATNFISPKENKFNTYTIYDGQGKVVKSGKITDNKIDISHLLSGIYTIELQNYSSKAVEQFTKL